MIAPGENISFYLLIGISKNIVDAFPINQYNIFSSSLKESEFRGLLDDLQYNGSELDVEEAIDYLDKTGLTEKSVILSSISSDNLYKFYAFIKIVAPSNIQLYASFEAKLDNEVNKFSLFEFVSRENSDFRYLSTYPFDRNDFTSTVLSIINGMDIFFRLKDDSFIYKIVGLYLEADLVTRDYVKFLLYVFTLEMLNIDDTHHNISYKFARLPAIMLGYDKETSSLVYKNLKKVYDIRSKIVHTASFEKLTTDLVKYLSFIISGIFSTLLYADLDLFKEDKKVLKELFNKANELGFGERHKLINHNIEGSRFIIKGNVEKVKLDLFPNIKKD